MKKIINIDELNDIYNNLINNDNISSETKRKVLSNLLNNIKDYTCYKDEEISCPYATIKSEELFDNNNKEIIVLCNYYNVAACSYNGSEINEILSCPVKNLRKKFKSFITQ